jgi:predicted nucleic acid-binding protein
MQWIFDNAEVGRIVFPNITADMLRRAESVRHRYSDLRLDLTDALNAVIMEEFETNYILTLDRRDFRSIKPLTEHAVFHLLPDDGL